MRIGRDPPAMEEGSAISSEPHHITVMFKGDGAGRGELTWGQSEKWSRIVARATWRDWLPAGGVRPLPPGTTLEEVADALGYLLSRYPPLRTLIRFGADGRTVQEVYGSGEIPLEIFETDAPDPDRFAEQVGDRYRNTELDFTTEWPIRMAVVRHRAQLSACGVRCRRSACLGSRRAVRTR